MGRLGFYFDQQACVGCRTCQVACKDKNRLDVGYLYRKVSSFETGSYPAARMYHVSMACNHCEHPLCVVGCPTGAMNIAADGTVLHDDAICVGCQYCTWNCPYSVPVYLDELSIVGKCNACKDLRDKGQNPVCVDACMMRAIEFGDLDELKAKHAGETLANQLPCIADASKSQPSLLIHVKPCALNKDFEKKEV